jgi:hypothetical protein
MTMLNEEILGVCGRGNSIIYLININTRKVIKEVKFKEFSSDYLSISTLLDSSIILNDSNKTCIHAKLIKEDNDYDLKMYRQVLDLYATSEKDFMGLTSFKGADVTLEDVRIAKNYLSEKEL